jgi:DNA-binding transcriptional LysR family regulator
MELRHLRYFVAVAEELHFARAAERVGIEQSPLSRAIRELERDLGAVLFTRTSRSTRMTRAGEILLVDARRLLSESRQLARRVRFNIPGKTGCLRFGISQAVADYRLSRLLAHSQREEPELKHSILEAPTSRLLDYLRDDVIDLAISCTEINASDLISHPIWTVPLAAVMSSAYPFSQKAGLRLGEVLDESSVVVESEVRQGCGALRTALDVSPVSAVSVLIEMAAAGMAVGIAPITQLGGLIRPEITVTALSDPSMIMTVYLILRSKVLANTCERFIRRASEDS